MTPTLLRFCTALTVLLLSVSCSQQNAGPEDTSTSEAPVMYDPTVARPVPPRDTLERWVKDRWGDLRLVDWLMDKKTDPPPLDREPLPPLPDGARIAENTPLLDDRDPFAEPPPLPPKEVTITVGLARSTYRTRTREEVLSAVRPFIDVVQREVNIRGAPELHETPPGVYHALLEGRNQMTISHVFDYLLVREWLAQVPDNGAIPLAWAEPANPRVTDLDRHLPGVPGTCIELIVADDAPYRTPADLKGTRLALAANYSRAPGAFLTRTLLDLGHPLGQPFFGRVTLRRYPKDAVIDVFKGKADVACVDQGTVGAVDRFYGLGRHLRTLAVSPRYNLDVLYTSANNVATHRTEIELTQQQLTTLGKDPEGQEVLWNFDTEQWHTYKGGDLAVPREHFADFVRFMDETPADLEVLLDPEAPVDARTYDRYGDEH